jgi:AcrR family transcriptional regulator
MTGRRRLTPEDWIQAALEALLKEGPSGLRIARLAGALGVTPGSFYWHFKDRGQFRTRILEYWMSQMLARAGDTAMLSGKGQAPIRALPKILSERGLPQYDAAIRTWGGSDPIVAAAVARADELRTRRAASMLREAGFDEDQALARARLVLWTHVGSIGADEAARTDALGELLELILRDAPEQTAGRARNSRRT